MHRKRWEYLAVKVLELMKACAYDLRDVNPASREPAWNQYTQMEMYSYLQRAARLVSKRLASRSNQLVMDTAELELAAGENTASLPTGHLAVYAVFIKGQESNGALMKLGPADAAVLTGTTPAGYYVQGSGLVVAPTPGSAVTLSLVYAGEPAFCLDALPESKAALEPLLAGDLPFTPHFDEALRQYVSISCANRNEYDTSVEQGLFKLLMNACESVASMDSMLPLEIENQYPIYGYDWSGRGG